jgi:hypothetical protein
VHVLFFLLFSWPTTPLDYLWEAYRAVRRSCGDGRRYNAVKRRILVAAAALEAQFSYLGIFHAAVTPQKGPFLSGSDLPIGCALHELRGVPTLPNFARAKAIKRQMEEWRKRNSDRDFGRELYSHAANLRITERRATCPEHALIGAGGFWNVR